MRFSSTKISLVAACSVLALSAFAASASAARVQISRAGTLTLIETREYTREEVREIRAEQQAVAKTVMASSQSTPGMRIQALNRVVMIDAVLTRSDSEFKPSAVVPVVSPDAPEPMVIEPTPALPKLAPVLEAPQMLPAPAVPKPTPKPTTPKPASAPMMRPIPLPTFSATQAPPAVGIQAPNKTSNHPVLPSQSSLTAAEIQKLNAIVDLFNQRRALEAIGHFTLMFNKSNAKALMGYLCPRISVDDQLALHAHTHFVAQAMHRKTRSLPVPALDNGLNWAIDAATIANNPATPDERKREMIAKRPWFPDLSTNGVAAASVPEPPRKKLEVSAPVGDVSRPVTEVSAPVARIVISAPDKGDQPLESSVESDGDGKS